jgi:hypothetical protein
MNKIALIVTLLAGSMAMIPTVDAATRPNSSVLRLAGWSCVYWESDGVSYNYCCRDSDGWCTGIHRL